MVNIGIRGSASQYVMYRLVFKTLCKIIWSLDTTNFKEQKGIIIVLIDTLVCGKCVASQSWQGFHAIGRQKIKLYQEREWETKRQRERERENLYTRRWPRLEATNGKQKSIDMESASSDQWVLFSLYFDGARRSETRAFFFFAFTRMPFVRLIKVVAPRRGRGVMCARFSAPLTTLDEHWVYTTLSSHLHDKQ